MMGNKEMERLAGVAADRTQEEMEAIDWAPLTNNDHCLALQTYLRIDVYFAEGFKQIVAYRKEHKNNDDMWGVVGYGAGTARDPIPGNINQAIVEAAWKLGRSKERRMSREAAQNASN